MPRGFRPRRGRGQNLLIDDDVVEAIAEAAALDGDSQILEIGAGTGLLTRALAQRAGSILAVEVDAELVLELRSQFKGYRNVSILRRDARQLDLDSIYPGSEYQVVANLPYSVGTPLVVDLIRSVHHPRTLTVMLQLEVAKRLCAQPGQWSNLTVMTRPFCQAQILFTVPPAAFWPRPKVTSAVLRIVTNDEDRSDPQIARAVFVARHAFAQRRKQLINSLSAGLRLDRPATAELLAAAAIDPAQRPAELSIEQWIALAAAIDPEQ